MKIIFYPDRILRQKAKPVEKVSAEIRQIFKGMADAMYLAGGVGLAGPQVGISKQMIIMDVGEGLKCLANPKVTKRKGTSHLEEGCLSFPGITVRVKRAAEVIVEAIDENGKPVRIQEEGLAAHVLQHEIDHLHGKVIIDYASWAEKLKLRAKLKKWEKEHPSAEAKCNVSVKCI
ncbi:MAG: peptide deformylase [Candidatus Omnitrophica bacterium]|nr:peptide deformylase [Candidatus Omnitrophota bacterium]MDD5236940.1 peptide deformylase [Candidatus Omnitrophota bacterium]MDD5610269.1 peptide deformylase [Candidatus Omnitrophota bacterium]